MRRSNRTLDKATQGQTESIADLARHIVSYGHRPHPAHFFDMVTEKLLISVLSDAMDQALERIRRFRSAPSEYPEELGFLSSTPMPVVTSVLAQAESALAAYIERTKSVMPHP